MGLYSNMTSVLIRRKASGRHTQRRDLVKTQEGGGHLPIKGERPPEKPNLQIP